MAQPHRVRPRRARRAAAAPGRRRTPASDETTRTRCMKAVRYHEYGPADVLRYEDVDVPEPGPGRGPRADRRRAASTTSTSTCAPASRAGRCRCRTSSGWSSPATVEAVGPGVEQLAEGDRVWPQHEVECGAMPLLPRGPAEPVPTTRGCSACSSSAATPRRSSPPRAATHLMPDGVTLRAGGRGAGRRSRPPGTCSSRAAGRARARPSSCRPPAAASATPPSRSPRSPARASSRPPAPTTSSRAPASSGARRDDQLPRGVDRPSACWR